MSDRSPLRLVDDGQSSLASQVTEETPNRNPTVLMTTQNTNNLQGDDIETQATTQRPTRARSSSEISTQSSQLKYGAKSVIDLFIPVSICMWFVIGTMQATNEYQYRSDSVNFYGHFIYKDDNVDNVGTKIWHSLLNAFFMLIMIVIMTTLLIVLYKYRFYKTIRIWLMMSSLMLLFIFTTYYITIFLNVYNVPIDFITLMIIVWNIGAVGMVSIHWKGPLVLQQAYLIMISGLMSLIFIKSLPDWTVWTVLATVSAWDLVAVLSPKGPLRILVETAQERNEPIFPALIYSSTLLWEFVILSNSNLISMAEKDQKKLRQPRMTESQQINETPTSSGELFINQAHPENPQLDDQWPRIQFEGTRPTTSNNPRVQFPNINSTHLNPEQLYEETNRASNNDRSSMETDKEERGVKLGLGDFIFYSLLVGKVSSYGDWTITLSCYVAVLVGLCLTLSLLSVFRKALPALPISIAFGLAFYFLSSLMIVPFASELSISQVFI